MPLYTLSFASKDLYKIGSQRDPQITPQAVRENTRFDLLRSGLSILPPNFDPTSLDYASVNALFEGQTAGLEPVPFFPMRLMVKTEYIPLYFQNLPNGRMPRRLAEVASLLLTQGRHGFFPYCEDHLTHFATQYFYTKMSELLVQDLVLNTDGNSYLQLMGHNQFRFVSIMKPRQGYSPFGSAAGKQGNISIASASTNEPTLFVFTYTITVRENPKYPDRFCADDEVERECVIGTDPYFKIFTEETNTLTKIIEARASTLRASITNQSEASVERFLVASFEDALGIMAELKSKLFKKPELLNHVILFLKNCLNAKSYTEVQSLYEDIFSQCEPKLDCISPEPVDIKSFLPDASDTLFYREDLPIQPYSPITPTTTPTSAEIMIRFSGLIKEIYKLVDELRSLDEYNPLAQVILDQLKRALDFIKVSSDNIQRFVDKLCDFVVSAFAYPFRSLKTILHFLSENIGQNEIERYTFLNKHSEAAYLLLVSPLNKEKIQKGIEQATRLLYDELDSVLSELSALVNEPAKLFKKLRTFEINKQQFWLKILILKFNDNPKLKALGLLLILDANRESLKEINKFISEAAKKPEALFYRWQSLGQTNQKLWIDYFKEIFPEIYNQSIFSTIPDFLDFVIAYSALLNSRIEERIPYLKKHLEIVRALIDDDSTKKQLPKEIHELRQWLLKRIPLTPERIYRAWAGFSLSEQLFWIDLFNTSKATDSELENIKNRVINAYYNMTKCSYKEFAKFRRVRLCLSLIRQTLTGLALPLAIADYEKYYEKPSLLIQHVAFKTIILGILAAQGLTPKFDKDKSLLERFFEETAIRNSIFNDMIELQTFPSLLGSLGRLSIQREGENEVLDLICTAAPEFILLQLNFNPEEISYKQATARLLAFSSENHKKQSLQALQGCSKEAFSHYFCKSELFINLLLKIETSLPNKEERTAFIMQFINTHIDALLNQDFIALFPDCLDPSSSAIKLLLKILIQKHLERGNLIFIGLSKLFKRFPWLLPTILEELAEVGQKEKFLTMLLNESGLANLGNLAVGFLQLSAEERNRWYYSSVHVQSLLADALVMLPIMEADLNPVSYMEENDFKWFSHLYSNACIERQEELIATCHDIIKTYLIKHQQNLENIPELYPELYLEACLNADVELLPSLKLSPSLSISTAFFSQSSRLLDRTPLPPYHPQALLPYSTTK